MIEPVTLASDAATPGVPTPGPTPAVAQAPAPRPGALPAALISLALLAANVLSYGFTVLAARLLTPAAYGELAALMGLLLVGAVPSAGLQTAVALHLGRHGFVDGADTRRLHLTAVGTALGVGVLGIAAAPPVDGLLHLSDPTAVAALVVLLVPHTVIGGYQGILQGSGRYGRLSAVTAAFGTAKVFGGVAGLLIGATPTAALAGMAVGACAGALLGWLGCGRPGLQRGARRTGRHVLRASAALLGFVVLLNLDLLLARHFLPATAAGEYAVAALFAKVAFWLPQGVGVVVLPRLADPTERRRALPAALGLIAAVGASLTLGTAALGASALPLVGGAAYGTGLGSVSWLFALLGTLCALAQLLVYSGIAAADRIAEVTVWTAVAVECAAVAALAGAGLLSVRALALTALVSATAVVVAGLVRALPERAHDQGE